MRFDARLARDIAGFEPTEAECIAGDGFDGVKRVSHGEECQRLVDALEFFAGFLDALGEACESGFGLVVRFEPVLRLLRRRHAWFERDDLSIDDQLGHGRRDGVHIGIDHLAFPSQELHAFGTGHLLGHVGVDTGDAVAMVADPNTQNVTAALVVAE